MANTVAYNNGSNPVGSIKKGVVSINVDNSLITSGLTWRNGIEFTNQYIIYSDTYTQGIDTQQNAKPCAWSCDYNDTALLNLINSLPALIGQPKYSTLAGAVAWLEGQGKYFIVNQNYPEIVTSGCVLNIDASMTGSYPNVNTTFYDISGNLKNGTLQNGVGFANSGTSSSMIFDGTDDTISLGNNLNLGTNPFTLEYLAKSDINLNQYAKIISKGAYLQGGWTSYFGREPNTGIYGISLQYGLTGWTGLGGIDPAVPNKWYHVVYTKDENNQLTSYINGVTGYTKIETYNFDSSANYVLGGNSAGNEKFKGNIQYARQYNRALSQSEVLQNYYKGKIVTNGLVLALDAGNLISYSGSGNNCYDLTMTGVTGTLTNGPTWSSISGGTFNFDGTDDRITFPNSERLRPSAFTVTSWVNCNVADGNQKTIFSSYYEIPVAGFAFQLYAGSGSNNRVRFFVGNNNGSGAGTYQDYTGSLNVPINRWNHITVSYDGTSTMRIYVNGVADATASWTGGCVYNVTNNKVQVGSNIDVSQFPGSISNLQFYNRTLTQSEIQQNFNTYRRRYGI
jgi:hypothetical protein